MAVTCTLSNHAKYQLGVKALNFETDTLKVLLMRNGYTFNKDDVAKLINIRTTSGVVSLTFAAGIKKISRTTGSFITDGFIVGNKITCDATLNPGPFTITSVVALEIVVSETVVDEGPVSKTLLSDDEHATLNGYTQNTKTTGAVTGLEDDIGNQGKWTFPTVTWTASGGDIGPTPGAIIFSGTSTDNTVIGYIDFGGNQTATTGNPFNILNGEIDIK